MKVLHLLSPGLLLSGLCLWIPTYSLAQGLPYIPPPPARPLSPPSPLPPPQELLSPLPTAPTLPSVLPEDSTDTIIVNQFHFEGNTVFTNEELENLIASYCDRPLTFSELLAARSVITQHYVQAGYVTSGAYIPPQTLEKGVVVIRILEGQLGTVNVSVEGKLNPNYVRDRLALAGEGVLNVPKLLTALQLLQLNPIIDKISAELAASAEPGQSILNVTVKTARSFYPQVLLDNGRNPLVGSFRRGGQLEEGNLTGNGDDMRATYRNTDGSNELDWRYSLPISASNTSVMLGYRNLTGKVVEAPFDVLDLRSYYEKYEVGIRQPVWQTPYQELAIALSFDYQNSWTTLLGEPFPTRGADADGQMRLASLRLSQEWLDRSDRSVLALRSEFGLGVDAFNPTVPYDAVYNLTAPNPNYWLWRGQSQWLQKIGDDALFVARTDLQITNSSLPSLEQFTLGGLGSVVGYRQNTLLTDSGLFAALEVRLPIYRIPEEKAVLQLVPFVNFGTGWNSKIPNPEINTLASVGVGLLWQYGNQVSARLDWGQRLGKIPYLEGNSLQDDGFVFSVTITP